MITSVWGASGQDQYTCDTSGRIWGWDGATGWQEERPSGDRLLDIHGSADCVIAVGARGRIETRLLGTWHTESATSRQLQHVFVFPACAAIAIGIDGEAFVRQTEGTWAEIDLSGLLRDNERLALHSVFGRSEGEVYIGGATTFDPGSPIEGALLRCEAACTTTAARWSLDRVEVWAQPGIVVERLTAMWGDSTEIYAVGQVRSGSYPRLLRRSADGRWAANELPEGLGGATDLWTSDGVPFIAVSGVGSAADRTVGLWTIDK